jgi:hypothetical protein
MNSRASDAGDSIPALRPGGRPDTPAEEPRPLGPLVGVGEDPAELLERLAEEYGERLRGGDRGELDKYISAHPESAERLERVFPVLGLMEGLRPQARAPEERQVTRRTAVAHYAEAFA